MIKKGIQLEIYRAFHNIYFVIALIFANGISLLHFVISVLPKTKSITGQLNLNYPYSVFNSCLPLDNFNYGMFLFYYSIILIGTLPFGVSYYTDLRHGYIKNIYTRMDKKGYLLGKYLAVFASAGTVCIAPLMLNLMLTMMVLPSLIPQPGTMQFPVLGSCMLSTLFYTHPYIYLLIYLLIDFILTGLFSCTALAVSRLMYNRYLVLFTPFILFFLLQSIFSYTSIPSAAPLFAMEPAQSVWQKASILSCEMLVLFLVSFIPFYFIGGKHHDTL